MIHVLSINYIKINQNAKKPQLLIQTAGHELTTIPLANEAHIISVALKLSLVNINIITRHQPQNVTCAVWKALFIALYRTPAKSSIMFLNVLLTMLAGQWAKSGVETLLVIVMAVIVPTFLGRRPSLVVGLFPLASVQQLTI